MKVTQISYEKTVSVDYNNVKIGVVVTLDENDTVETALKRAREYMTRQVDVDSLMKYELEEANRISAATKELSVKSQSQIDRAKRILTIVEDSELPF